MIYTQVNATDPLKQGDIFIGIPRIDLALEKMIVVNGDTDREMKWVDISQDTQKQSIMVPVRSVAGIIASQDCDACTGDDVTLCEICDFSSLGQDEDKDRPAKWAKTITTHAQRNLKCYYLPIDEKYGFTKRMFVDFRLTLRIPRIDLENIRSCRKGRLNLIAREHFREKIANFFRRYAFNEWYPMDKTEYTAYAENKADVFPYDWQK